MGRGPITRRSFPREAFPRDDAQGYVSARAAIRARKRIIVHHRAETLREEKISSLSDPNQMMRRLSRRYS